MQLEVYQTDAEAFEAAAALAAEHLKGAGAGARRAIALPGGRDGRGFLLALATRTEVRWQDVDCFLTDEVCLAPDDSRSHGRIARDSLFMPRGVPAASIHLPSLDAGAPDAIAAAYAAAVGARPAFDVVVLAMGDDARIAGLLPGARALEAAMAVATVGGDELAAEPRVARITLTPSVLRAARHVIVTAVGNERTAALASVLREPVDVARRPAQLVLPSPTVTWVVDRAAAEALLRDASVASGDAQ